MEAYKIDKIDRRILIEIQKDCALSIEALAERVYLSRNACWRRIKRLDESGYIKKRAALLDAKKLGLSLSVIVLVKTNQHDKSWLENFRDAVQAMPEIMGAHRMTGELDYMLQIRVTDMEAYDSFYRRLIDLVPIADVSASFVMEDLKETTELPL